MTLDPMNLCTAALDGSTLIEASAGTGKTYTLTALFLRLILEKRLTVDQILVVTFTDAATEELRGRIRGRLAEAAHLLEQDTCPDAGKKPFEHWLWTAFGDTDAVSLLAAAVRHFDLAQIFTIHGFCRRMLTRNGFESQALFTTELEPDLSDLLRQVCVDFWRQRLLPLDGLTGTYVRSTITPDTLQALGSLPFLAQDIRVEPNAPAPDPALAEAAFAGLHQDLSARWALCRDEVRGLLLNHTGLKQNMARPEWLESRLSTLEQWLQRTHPQVPEACAKLFPEYIAKMAKKGATPPEHTIFALIEATCTAAEALNTALNAYCVSLRRDFLLDLPEAMDRLKQDRNVQSFDDLLRAMRRAVDNPGLVAAAREQYRAALIDEFQDTDGLQYAIFGTLFGQDHPLFLIGDPKQAIYSFRGADLQTYIYASGQCERSATLDTNYRSRPELIRAVNTIFSSWDNPFLQRDIVYRPVHASTLAIPQLTEHGAPVPAMTVWQPLSEDGTALSKTRLTPRICRTVAAEIARLLHGAADGHVRLGDNPLRPGHIAILVETHRQGDMMHRALRSLRIHSVLAHSASVFESAEALDVLTVLRAVADYQRPNRMRAALATPILGLDAQALLALEDNGPEQDQWLERLAVWHEVWQQSGVMAALSRLLGETAARQRLLGLPGGERRMTNVLHCLEILHARERETNATMHVLLTWFSRQISGNRRDEHQLRLDSDRDAVRIVTIHKSKGLEYPVLFCPFLFKAAKVDEDRILAREQRPDGAHGLILDLGSEKMEERQQAALAEAQAELIRLTYVALTRASSRCYLVWGRINTADTSGPAWLFHGHRAGDGKLSWKQVSEDDVQADLQELAGNDIEVLELPDLPATPLPLADDAPETLHARNWTRRLGPGFSLASFSGLTRGAAHALPPGLDDDDTDGDQPEAMTMARFPRGATAGSCLHRIFETVQFTDRATIPEAVRLALIQYGIEDQWQGVVEDMVDRVLTAPLAEFRLEQIRDRLVELEFLFPLRPITHQDLAAVYRAHSRHLPDDLPERMDRLRFEPRRGFLTGFMDLVFRHDGKYYLLDWKSNWLGPTPASYTPDALHRAMTDSHYHLQYHLYCLALNRYLALRLPDYDYDRNFGGVVYVFLRGVDPGRPGQGLYIDRPDQDFLQALDTVLIASEEH